MLYYAKEDNNIWVIKADKPCLAATELALYYFNNIKKLYPLFVNSSNHLYEIITVNDYVCNFKIHISACTFNYILTPVFNKEILRNMPEDKKILPGKYFDNTCDVDANECAKTDLFRILLRDYRMKKIDMKRRKEYEKI